jgi:DNA-binding transcriptional MerR regulator
VGIRNQMDSEDLDVEWIDLILTARKMGLSMDDVRAFLRGPAHPAQNMYIPAKNDQTYVPMGFISTTRV